jgi:MinD superfamily P-loop ATPase
MLKEISILSGKGGTGKTSVSSSLAAVAKKSIFVDIDVEAPDLHLILNPIELSREQFISKPMVQIDKELCTKCGKCIDYCKFDAIDSLFNINEFSCESCLLCQQANAVRVTKNNKNFCIVSKTRFGPMIHPYLHPGEDSSGKMVQFVRSKAKEYASEHNLEFIINDGPPGVGCTAISSISKCDAIVIVFEPTETSFHDAGRLVELVQSFKIPIFSLINKFDLNNGLSKSIEKFCIENNITVLSKIPFSRDMLDAVIAQKSIVEYKPDSDLAHKFFETWIKLKKSI